MDGAGHRNAAACQVAQRCGGKGMGRVHEAVCSVLELGTELEVVVQSALGNWARMTLERMSDHPTYSAPVCLHRPARVPSTTACWFQESNPLVGSSHSSTAGQVIMVRPTETRLASAEGGGWAGTWEKPGYEGR